MVYLLFSRPSMKLRDRLVYVKDKPPGDKKSNLIYGFKCKGPGCTEAYVGETKQSLKACFSQHRRPSSSEHQADYPIYEHTRRSGHLIDSEDFVILDRQELWFERVEHSVWIKVCEIAYIERGVREAIWEQVEKPSLNFQHVGLRFQLSHGPIIDQYSLPIDTWPVNNSNQHQFISAVA